MATKRSPVEAASERIAVLREIVKRERIRAEASPDSRRDVELGLVEEGQPRGEARVRIAEIFDQLGYLIDHLHVAHMAACFEAAAMARLATIIGDAKSAVEKSRKGVDRWPANLVRKASEFEGLHDIGEVMPLDEETREMFSAIRKLRNRFSHAPLIDAPPVVTSDQALRTLSDMLLRLR